MSASEIIPMPERLRSRPIDRRWDLPVPWFVTEVDARGRPEFRAVRNERVKEAFEHLLCWVCGQRLGRNIAFVLGPMSSITRVSSEPACHRDCAIYAVRVCPHLVNPNARRRTAGMPKVAAPAEDGRPVTPGGVMAVYVTRGVVMNFVPPDSVILFYLDAPTSIEWFKEGRAATRLEVEDEVATKLPQMLENAERQGPEAVRELDQLLGVFQDWVPEK